MEGNQSREGKYGSVLLAVLKAQPGHGACVRSYLVLNVRELDGKMEDSLGKAF